MTQETMISIPCVLQKKTKKKKNEHGTQVAGPIIAIENNNKGIVGIHPHAKLVSVKAKSNWTYTSKSVMQWINFIKHNNVEIINLSMNSNPASSIYADILVYNAIRDFDGIIINSAWNENANIDNHDTEFVYPSSYRSNFYFQGILYQWLNNLIVVGAEQPDGTKRETSNFWKKSVDIFTPGWWFQTTHTNNTEKYTTSGWTSLAAPIVVWVLSLAKSAYPQKNMERAYRNTTSNRHTSRSLQKYIN